MVAFTDNAEYIDGPYCCDEEPNGAVKLKMPTVQKFSLVGIPPTFISVDMDDNFRSDPPFFLLGISFIQILYFVLYVFTQNGGVIEAHSPVAGPEGLWMKAISEFPECLDLRPEAWRLVSYQLVHAGYQVTDQYELTTFANTFNKAFGYSKLSKKRSS